MPRYNFDVQIINGVGKVVNITREMPDGLWSVGGSYDEFGAGVNVTHRLPHGQFVAEAQHFSNPENYKAPDIPGLQQLKAAYISMGFSPADAEKHAMVAASATQQAVPIPTSIQIPQGSPPNGGESPVPLNPDTGHPWAQHEALEYDAIKRAAEGKFPEDEGPGSKFSRETDMRRRGDIRD